MGHVNNAVFASYIEVARTAYWCELFELESYNEVDFILARLEIDFLAPLFVQDRLEVWTRVSQLGTRSFRMAYELVRPTDAVTVARGESVQVMYDYATGATKSLSDEQRRKILAFEDAQAVDVGG
jgi:acyl-CoA thioester hydrolase